MACHVAPTGEVRACWVSNARGLLANDLLELAYSSRFSPLEVDGVAKEWLHTFRFRINANTGAVVGMEPDGLGAWQLLGSGSHSR